jgi:hypothetical protein
MPRSTQKSGMNDDEIEEIFQGNADLKWKL